MNETADCGRCEKIPLLSPDECQALVRQIHDCRDLWTQRHSRFPFYSLGAASYLDAAKGGFDAYRRKVQDQNPGLRKHFEWLYRRLAGQLTEQLGGEVFYDDSLALPGFHVFLSHPAFSRSVASVHYDLQYRDIEWNGYGDLDFARQLSLTLSVRLPAAGGGLRLWNIDFLEIESMPEEERKEWMGQNRKATLVPYQEGSLVIHSGHQLHQIAPMEEMTPEDQRITLQAHAVPTEQGWLLYW